MSSENGTFRLLGIDVLLLTCSPCTVVLAQWRPMPYGPMLLQAAAEHLQALLQQTQLSFPDQAALKVAILGASPDLFATPKVRYTALLDVQGCLHSTGTSYGSLQVAITDRLPQDMSLSKGTALYFCFKDLTYSCVCCRHCRDWRPCWLLMHTGRLC